MNIQIVEAQGDLIASCLSQITKQILQHQNLDQEDRNKTQLLSLIFLFPGSASDSAKWVKIIEPLRKKANLKDKNTLSEASRVQ